ncbi:MAG: HEAT repeat domain-containing protein [Planctomycetes bacterium]|nr:HEAT repeat domain-containing protein [Planctomycetota bacterium]
MKHSLTTLALALVATLAFADTLTTTDGRKLEGKVKDLGDEIVLEGKLGSTRFKKSQVEKIEYGKTTLDLYGEKAAALKDDDAKGHWALAKWCKESGLEAEYRKEAGKVIGAEPNHEEARLALGHKQVAGQWMSPDEIHVANGEVKRNGDWMTADEGARLDAEESARKCLGEAGLKDAAKADAAVVALLKLRQDSLLGPCVRSVASSNKGTRLAAWKGLQRYFVWTGATLHAVRNLQERFDKLGDLTSLALREKDDDVRAVAIEATRGMGDEYARMWYQKRVIEEESLDARRRSARVLGEMGSAESVPYLMAAFYTVYMEVRATNAVQSQDITDSFVDFFPDPTRTAIPTPLRIETPKMSVQRVQTTVAVPEGFHQTSAEFGAVLQKLTGQEFGDDYTPWNKWYRTGGKDWVKKQIEAEREAKVKAAEGK